MSKPFLLSVLVLLAPALVAADQQVLEVITLGYRQADDVIPIVRPLLVPGGTVTGMNNRLVVRTTPANLAELKQVLAVIDSRPRRLQISVRQISSAERSQDSASVSGTVGAGNAQVSISRPSDARKSPGVGVQSGRPEVQGHITSSRSARDDGVTQTVQVLEGNAAFISAGQSVPTTTTQITRMPDGSQVTQSTQMIDADTGFYATPRVNGDQVTLEISTSRDRLRNPATGAINVQHVGTIVSGRLGEWIEIGGMTERIDRSESEILARTRDARTRSRRVMLMVEELK